MKTITDIRNPRGMIIKIDTKGKKLSDIPPARIKMAVKVQWHVINLRDA